MVPDWAASSSPRDCAGNNPAKHAATTKLHENIRLNIFFILRSRIPSIRKNMDRPEASIREKERLPSIPNSGTLSPCDQHSSYCPASCRLFPPAGAEAPRLKRITSRRQQNGDCPGRGKRTRFRTGNPASPFRHDPFLPFAGGRQRNFGNRRRGSGNGYSNIQPGSGFRGAAFQNGLSGNTSE